SCGARITVPTTGDLRLYINQFLFVLRRCSGQSEHAASAAAAAAAAAGPGAAGTSIDTSASSSTGAASSTSAPTGPTTTAAGDTIRRLLAADPQWVNFLLSAAGIDVPISSAGDA